MNKTTAAMMAVLLLIASSAFAMPPIAAEYYGNVTINSHSAGKGTNVSIYDEKGNMCGSGLVRTEGQFGFISCNGDDPYTAEDEGARNGENVTIAVNGTKAGTAAWFEGSINQLQINVKLARVNSSLPGIMLLPLIPIMAMIAAYLYISRKI